ncbi:MAG: argininosuccinate lyase [Phycisphaeraceae bacterium]|nr:MAG: argininosuccinate lyase [Phycisphaeraceae bacterium]
MALWGGRFEGRADDAFRAVNDSLRFDWRLVEQDIEGSIAWAGALRAAGVLSAAEEKDIAAALRAIADDAASIGPVAPDTDDEDVHSWVEARLIDRIGDLGKKLHTGRSRNDQVATDLRLFTRVAIDDRLAELRALQRALLDLAEREIDTIIPGYTHLQRAQPVPFAHWCLAYFEMFERDAQRLRDARRRVNICPLGAGALAGTAYPIDRAALAKSLGFDAPAANSLDAVSDRDFVLETIGACALCAIHLSRIAEDLIIYNSAEFGFIELDDAHASGSSLMPQKKNPDGLELMRGKCGRILGAHVALATTLKGLPLAYNKDMQEDKEPIFDAMDSLSLCLRIAAPTLGAMKLHPETCLLAARGGHANATELADYLVEKGVPFRTAHDITGRIVREAITKGAALEQLSIEEMRRHDQRIEQDVFERLSLKSTLASRDVTGGAAPKRVQSALKAARTQLDKAATDDAAMAKAGAAQA